MDAQPSVAARCRAAPAAGACALAVALLLAGCGQKGPLKRPDPAASAAASAVPR